MATTLMPELPREFLAAARKGQEYALDAIRTWAQTVQSAIPELRTPQFPFADRLPKPETVLANAYDFAGQLLASQRHFAEELLKATEPLMPAIGNGRRHAPDATNARQTPATDTARTAPRTPAAPTATARTAPEAPAAHAATARPAPEAPAAHTPATHTATARTAPEAPAAHTAAASTPRTTRTAPKAATSTTGSTRTAPKAAASRRKTTPKAGR